MNIKYAKYLLKKTTDDYNRIAPLFSRTRDYLPEDIIALKQYVKPKSHVLDLGCGNGRLYELFQNDGVSYTGVDVSENLINIAQERYPSAAFQVSDPLKTTFSDSSFDVVFNLAVFHHIPSTQLRVAYLKEIRRILKPKGKLVFTVWNLWARKGMFWTVLKYGFFYPKLDLNDIFLPFRTKDGKSLADRYIHCFRADELEELFMEAGFKVLKTEKQRRGRKAENENILIIAEK
ncbi:MAG: class I SAM-dependent methyltransferase [Candidatus Berkelbacteria bacterium]